MKITSITTYLLSDTLDERFYFSQFEYASRLICVVKVATDEGIVGWGEGYGPAEVIRSAIDFFTPMVIGRDPLQGEVLWNDMYRRALDYARKGVMLSAISAIDIALWDIRGKALGQSVSTLLGGRFREKTEVYATGLYFTHTSGNMQAKLADEALLYKSQGYRAIKMKVGLGVRTDIDNVTAVRKAIGDGIKLMVDSNHAYLYREALELALALEPLGIHWFEEPLAPDDYAGYRELRRRTTIPLAAGECEFLRVGFRQLLEGRCVDFIQPETCTAGGITETKKIVDMAYAHYVEMTPHNWGTGIAVAANLHLTANLCYPPGRMVENQPLLEFDRSPNRLREELLVRPFNAVDGYLDIPACPGLGIEIDEEKLKYFSQKSSYKS